MYFDLNTPSESLSTMLVNPSFERRLKSYDPSLELHFCQNRKRWCVLEACRDGSGLGKLLIVAENSATHEPMPLGDWVFVVLNEMHQEWQDCATNPDLWHDKRVQAAEQYKSEQERKIREESRLRIIDDISMWRKAKRDYLGR